jgi:signal transduction histidine kinase
MILDGILQSSDSDPRSQLLATADASTMIERAVQQVRSISHLLHPPLLDEVGLSSAVCWFLDGFSKRSGIGTSLDMQPQTFPRLTPELETAAFRIVQEALNNVFRHSGARNSWVAIRQQDGHLTVTVRDNGKGLGEGVIECRPDSIGVGIGGMRQRVKEFGGELRLQNCHPGTLLLVDIPIGSHTYHEEGAASSINNDVLADTAGGPALPFPDPASVSKSLSTLPPSRISALSNEVAGGSTRARVRI